MILERLKTETRPHHDAIEKVAFSDKIMGGALSLDEYRLLVTNNYIMNSLVERQLDTMGEFVNLPGLDFEARKKTNLLIKDLEILGLDVNEINRHEYSFKINDLYEGLGTFYVLEGSTLGGSVISRQLVKNANLASVSEYNFYGCYGDQVGPMWKNFQMVLMNVATDKEKEDKMVASASRTFDFLRNIFENSLVKA